MTARQHSFPTHPVEPARGAIVDSSPRRVNQSTTRDECHNFVAKMPVQLSAKFRHMSLRVSVSPAIVSPFIHNIRALCQNEQTDSIRDSSILVFNPIVKTESPGWSTFKFAVFEFRYFRHSDVCQTVRQ